MGRARRQVLKRLLSAIILIPIVVVVTLYAPAIWFTSVVSLLILATIKECNAIIAGGSRGAWSWLPIFMASALPFLYLFDGGMEGLSRYLSGAVLILFIAAMVSSKDLKIASEWVRSTIFSIIYIALPFSLLALLAVADNGRLWILFILLLVWSNDTFAFCTGKLIGRHKLSPNISPGKSIEGAAGGLLGGVVVILIFNHYCALGLELPTAIALALVLGVLSILGDLFESLIKRGSDVKDSGSLIPGHGGILDRVDSMVFVVPALYYFLLFDGIII